VLLAPGFGEAHELLASNQVGVIVAGQERAGDAAIDFFRRIKQLHPRAVRVLLTGDTSATNLADAINSGSVYKLATKPWSESAIIGTLASAYSYHAQV